jgi:hypothetical protein
VAHARKARHGFRILRRGLFGRRLSEQVKHRPGLPGQR